MTFDLPELPEGFRGTRWSLGIGSVVDLTVEEVTRILECVDLVDEGDAHSRIFTPMHGGERDFELFAMLGVHGEGGGREDGAFAHIELSIELDPNPRDSKSGSEWDDLFSAFALEAPQLIANMRAYWQFPKEDASFGVELPIPLDDLNGFTQIGGMRLVQRDPDSGQHLYSLILDETRKNRSAQVSTELELEAGSGILVAAWDRALAIAGLAVEPPMPIEDV